MSAKWADFLYEVGHLKRVQRSGWWLAGVERAESVAEHSFRAAVLAFTLAVEEGADPDRAASLALFHDLGEARVNDLHHLGKRYADWAGVEDAAVADQLRGLPPALQEAVHAAYSEASERQSLEARIARDADHLECLLQGREYAARGFDTREWVETARAALDTEAARRFADAALEAPVARWREPPRSS